MREIFGFRKSGNGTRKDFTLTTAGEMALLYHDHPELFPADCPSPYASVNNAAKKFSIWISANPQAVAGIVARKIEG